MPDSQFDDFVGRQLNDLSAPVPEGLWQRLSDQQLDDHFKEKLSNLEVPVSEGTWQKVSDIQFDNHVSEQLANYIAPVPAGAYEQLDDTRLDRFFGNSLYDWEAPVGPGVWNNIAESLLDTHAGSTLNDLETPVPDTLWNKIADQQFDTHISGSLQSIEAPVPSGLWDKITDQQFDDHFRAGLENYEAPVSEEVWKRIMPEEEKDRGFFYWFRIPMAAAIAGALFLGGVLATYVIYKRQAKTGSEQPAVVISGEGGSLVPPRQENNTAPHQDRALIPPASLDSVDKRSDAPQKKLMAPGQDAIAIDENTMHDQPVESGKSATRNWLGIRKNKSTAPITSGFKINAPVIDLQNERAQLNEKNLQQSPTNPLPVYVGQEADAPSYKSYPYGNTIAIERNTQSAAQELRAQSAKQIALPKINCPPVRGRNKWDDFNRDWYVDTYVSPDYSMKTISNISASQQYLRQKDSSEQMQVGFSAGVRLVKPLNDRVQLTTGLQYSQINQRYTYRSENEVKYTTVISVRTIIRSPGDTLVIRDTSLLQTIGYKNNVIKNRFRSIDVPILLGYQFGRGSVKVGINAGIILNVSSWYEGVILDTAMAVVPLQKGSNVYKSKLGLGLYTGIQVTKELSKEMTLFAEPYYRHSFDNITTGSLPYHQKFGTAGVLMGVRWSLNRK